jgi:hypothetical protein
MIIIEKIYVDNESLVICLIIIIYSKNYQQSYKNNLLKKVYKKSSNVNKKIKNSLIFADSHKQVHK